MTDDQSVGERLRAWLSRTAATDGSEDAALHRALDITRQTEQLPQRTSPRLLPRLLAASFASVAVVALVTAVWLTAPAGPDGLGGIPSVSSPVHSRLETEPPTRRPAPEHSRSPGPSNTIHPVPSSTPRPAWPPQAFPTLDPEVYRRTAIAEIRVHALRDAGSAVIARLERGDLVMRLGSEGSEWQRIQFQLREEEWAFGWVQAQENATRPVRLASCTVMNIYSLGGGRTPPERVPCFGGETFTFGPVWIGSASDRGPNVVPGTPAWLAEAPPYEITGGGDGGALAHVLAHAAPGVVVPVEHWLQVAVRLDHPASASCTRRPEDVGLSPESPEEQVLWCRQQLVIVAARPTDAPTPPPLPTGPLSE